MDLFPKLHRILVGEDQADCARGNERWIRCRREFRWKHDCREHLERSCCVCNLRYILTIPGAIIRTLDDTYYLEAIQYANDVKTKFITKHIEAVHGSNYITTIENAIKGANHISSITQSNYISPIDKPDDIKTYYFSIDVSANSCALSKPKSSTNNIITLSVAVNVQTFSDSVHQPNSPHNTITFSDPNRTSNEFCCTMSDRALC